MQKLLSLLFLLITASLTAQTFSVANLEIIKGSIADAEKVANAYLLPLERSLNTSAAVSIPYLNDANGNKLIFRAGLEIEFIFAHATHKTFDVNSLSLEQFQPADPAAVFAQSFAGNDSQIILESKANYKVPQTSFPFYREEALISISTLGGRMNPMILPVLNAGISTKNWAVSLRGSPPLKFSDKSIGFWNAGLAVQYSPGKAFDGIKNEAVTLWLLTSVQINRISYYPMLIPDETKTGISLQSNNGPYDNQSLDITAFTIPFRVLLTQQIRKYHVYAGAGLSYQASGVQLKGRYPVYFADQANLFRIIVKDFTDPFDYNRRNVRFALEAGTTYDKGRFDLSGAVSFSKYLMITLAAGLKN
jgi:hypothetical protein